MYAAAHEGVYSTVLTNGKLEPPRAESAGQEPKAWVRNVPHKDGNWASYVYIKGESIEVSHPPQGLAWNTNVTFCGDVRCVAVPNHKELVTMIRASIKEGQERLERGLEADKHDELAGPVDEPQPPCVFVENDMSAEACQHLSLSKTLYLRSHHIEPFVADVKKALHWAKS
jgi:hypothetical protein